MVSRRNKTLLSLSVFLAVWAWNVSAAVVKGETGVDVGSLTSAQIEEQLQVCGSNISMLPILSAIGAIVSTQFVLLTRWVAQMVSFTPG